MFRHIFHQLAWCGAWGGQGGLRRVLATLTLGAALSRGGRPAAALAQPVLEVALQPDRTLRLSWPRTANTFTLESTEVLDAAPAWQRVDVPVEVDAQADKLRVVWAPAKATTFFRLRETGLTHLVSRSPEDGEPGVAVTRPTVVQFDRPLSAETELTTHQFYAEAGGRRMLGRVELSRDRRTATLFYLEPLPGNSRLTVYFDSTGLQDQLGAPVDGDHDNQPGGLGVWRFDTLSTTPLPGTVVVGRVFAAELLAGPDTGTNAVNRPLEGVTITVDGREQDLRTTTDAAGNFRLEPVPAGRFFVHIDGRTARGSAYPQGAF